METSTLTTVSRHVENQPRARPRVAPRRRPREADEYDDVTTLFAALRRATPGSAQAKRQREIIFARFLPLADRIARHYRGRGEDIDDLTQVARLGLANAVNRFDPAKGSDFAAFAVPTMMGEVRRHFRDNGWSVHVPRRLTDRHGHITSAAAELTQALRCAPTAGQLAAHLELSRQDVVQSLLAAQCYHVDSIDAPVSGGGVARTLCDTIAAVDGEFDRITDLETVRPLLAALSERRRTVLYLRFFESMTQSQIADKIGVSQMQVSRILEQTLREIREQL